MPDKRTQTILRLKRRITEGFTHENWAELGLITSCTDIIENHPRLLRSLFFGDEDYGTNIISVLTSMSKRDSAALSAAETYLDTQFPVEDDTCAIQKSLTKKVIFNPDVFAIPDQDLEDDLVAVMMPFSGFDDVYRSIKEATIDAELRCLRADDIWENSSILQDIFNLIFRAKFVVVDFSHKNPNVMYETGIAHTLGKPVIPIAQNVHDIPSDISHHRALVYLNNSQGLKELRKRLSAKLKLMMQASYSS